jgi:2-dehydropantoate 2-reductase
MKIAVIGIGAMGSFYAAKLSKTNDVIAFEHFENKVNIINKEGINLVENDFTTNYKVRCFKDGEVNNPVDLVIVCVKATQTQEAIKANLGLIGPNTIVLTLQNGLGAAKDLSKFVDPTNIVIGSSRVTVSAVNPNTYKVIGNGLTYVGSLTGDKKDVLIVKVVFDKASFECEVHDDIDELVWKKALINSVINPLCAIFKCKIKVLFENKYIYDIATRLVEESVKVANLDNCKLDLDSEIEELRQTMINMGNGYASMYYDVTNSRMTEIDKLNGQILTIAYKNKLDVPYTEFVVNTIKGMEKLY